MIKEKDIPLSDVMAALGFLNRMIEISKLLPYDDAVQEREAKSFGITDSFAAELICSAFELNFFIAVHRNDDLYQFKSPKGNLEPIDARVICYHALKSNRVGGWYWVKVPEEYYKGWTMARYNAGVGSWVWHGAEVKEDFFITINEPRLKSPDELQN